MVFFGTDMFRDIEDTVRKLKPSFQEPDEFSNRIARHNQEIKERDRQDEAEAVRLRERRFQDWRARIGRDTFGDQGDPKTDRARTYWESGETLRTKYRHLADTGASAFGRGTIDRDQWQKMWDDDPLQALAINPRFSILDDGDDENYRGIPADAREFVGQMRGVIGPEGLFKDLGSIPRDTARDQVRRKEEEYYRPFDIDRIGPITAAIGGLVGGGVPGMLVAGITQPIEAVGAAAIAGGTGFASSVLGGHLGSEYLARKGYEIAAATGADVRLSQKEKAAFALENAAGFASLVVGGSLVKAGGRAALTRMGGSAGEAALARIGIMAGRSAWSRALAEVSAQGVANLTMDVPAVYGSMRLRGADNGEAMKWAGITALFDVGFAALPVGAKPAIKAGGREVLVGTSAYYGAQMFGMDEEDARTVALGAVAMTFGVRRVPAVARPLDSAIRDLKAKTRGSVPTLREWLVGEEGMASIPRKAADPEFTAARAALGEASIVQRSGGVARVTFANASGEIRVDRVRANTPEATIINRAAKQAIDASRVSAVGAPAPLGIIPEEAPSLGGLSTVREALASIAQRAPTGIEGDAVVRARGLLDESAGNPVLTQYLDKPMAPDALQRQLEAFSEVESEPRVAPLSQRDPNGVPATKEELVADSLGAENSEVLATLKSIEDEAGTAAPPPGTPPFGAPPAGGGATPPSAPIPASQVRSGLGMNIFRNIFGLKDKGGPMRAYAKDIPGIHQYGDDVVGSTRMAGGLKAMGERMDSVIPGSSKLLVPFYKIDPSLNKVKPVLAGAVSAHGFTNNGYIRLMAEYIRLNNIMKPLMGESAQRRLSRATVNLTPAAAAAGLAFSDLPISDEQERVLERIAIVLGLGTTGALTRMHIVPLEKAFYNIKLKNLNLEREVNGKPVRVSTSALGKGIGKFWDIMDHPDDYRLTDAQRASRDEIKATMDRELSVTNEFEQWAGADVTPMREGRAGPQFFTQDSLAKAADIYPEVFPRTGDRPPFAREQSFMRNRELADNISDALLKFPELKVDGTPIEMIMRDLRDKILRQSNLIFASRLVAGTEGETGWVNATKLDALQSKLTAVRNDLVYAEKQVQEGTQHYPKAPAEVARLQKELSETMARTAAEKKRLRLLGWHESWTDIPGFPANVVDAEGKAVKSRFLFDRDIAESVAGMTPEMASAFEGFLDNATAATRTLLFTMDMSPWLTQFPMILGTNVSSLIRAGPTLIAASVFGGKFMGKWVEANRAWVSEFSRAGGVNGHLVDELAKGSAARIPGISFLENRGFQNFLPAARFIVAKHNLDGDMLFTKMEHSSHRSFRMIEKAPLRAMREAIGWGGALYGIQTLRDKDENENMENIFAAAIALAINPVTAQLAFEAAGKMGPPVSPAVRRKAVIRVAREMNRSSGILNKAALGITRGQARVERIALFNSPAFTRNMFLALKWAAMPNAEGAMARVYLLRTGLVAGSMMVAWKLALTGEMDSLDPTDENSVFHPVGFARAEIPGLGKFSTANPILSLARAVMKAPYVQGADQTSGGPGPLPEYWSPTSGAKGLAESMIGRMPVLGRAGLNYVWDASKGEWSFTEGLKEAGKAIGESAIPLPLQGLAEGGFFHGAPMGFDRPDVNINSRRESVVQSISNFLGMNSSPETIAQERRRLIDDSIRAQFPNAVDHNKNGFIDEGDLNGRDKERFRDSEAGRRSKEMGEEIAKQYEDEPPTPQERYILSIDTLRTEHIAKLQELEQYARAGEDKNGRVFSLSDFRQAVGNEQRRYQAVKEANKQWMRADPSMMIEGEVKDPKTGKAIKMNVVDYFDRAAFPEDEAVDAWYKLYEDATVGGNVNFDMLEVMQRDFLAELDPQTAAYVQDRVKYFSDRGLRDAEGNLVRIDMLGQLDKAKETARPYWEIREDVFTRIAPKSKFLSEFSSYGDLSEWVRVTARDNGMSESEAWSALRNKYRALNGLERVIEKEQWVMRRNNPALEDVLVGFYGRAPLRSRGIRGMRYQYRMG